MSTSAIRGADRAVAVCNALRNFLPELLALSASSPFVENVNTGLHSARTQIFTRMFPRCGVPDAFDGWDGFEQYVRFLYETGSIDQHTQLWWSVRPHLAFPTVEIRICDAQPDLARGALAGRAHLRADGADRPGDRRARAAARPAAPPDRGELLARDPLRPLGRADRPRDRACVPARARHRAAGRVGAPVAEELGPRVPPRDPAANAAERQIARSPKARASRRSTRNNETVSRARTNSGSSPSSRPTSPKLKRHRPAAPDPALPLAPRLRAPGWREPRPRAGAPEISSCGAGLRAGRIRSRGGPRPSGQVRPASSSPTRRLSRQQKRPQTFQIVHV